MELGSVSLGLDLGLRSSAVGKATLALVVSFVALGLANIVFGIWFAQKENRWIWERGGYASHEELRVKERKWAWAFLWFVVAMFVFYLPAALFG